MITRESRRDGTWPCNLPVKQLPAQSKIGLLYSCAELGATMNSYSSKITVVMFGFLLLLGIAAPFAPAQRQAGPNRPSVVPADYVITPFGYFHPSCVRGLGDGETLLSDGRVQHANGAVDASAPVCAYPRYTSRGELVVAPGKSKLDPLLIAHSWIEDGAATTTTACKIPGIPA